MAIQTKKRARLNRMMTSSTSTKSSNNNTKSSSSISYSEEEYEHAVSFLRKFHSRSAALPILHLHTTSLDAILETPSDRFDEMLAGDFALALNMVADCSTGGNSGNGSSYGYHHGSCSSRSSSSPPSSPTMAKSSTSMKRKESSSFLQVIATDVPSLDNKIATNSNSSSPPNRLRRTSSNLSRMKKATTSKCLSDLDDAADADSDSRSTMTTLSDPSSGSLGRSTLFAASSFSSHDHDLVRPSSTKNTVVIPCSQSQDQDYSTDDKDLFLQEVQADNDNNSATATASETSSFGYYYDDEATSSLLPMTKRHRMSYLCGRAAA